MMVTGFSFKVLDEYNYLPQLRFRTTVKMLVRKQQGEKFDNNATLYP